MRGYKHLSAVQRLQLETLLSRGVHKREIADFLGIHISTLYRELKRGCYKRLEGSTWLYKESYSSDIAEQKYRENLKCKGGPLKIGRDFKLANYIEHKICNEKYTPAAVLGEIKANGLKFDTSIGVNTLYSYIEKGVFRRLTNKHLPLKSRQKKRKPRKQQKRAPRGTSIERRPQEISARETFGNWEMDCICGSTKAVFLVLTERLTRREIILKMPNQKSDSVLRCLNKLERRYGRKFSKVFKSITVDNGVEFSDFAGMEKSCLGARKRTEVYYCHAYSAWERGTNERINREIRRIVPKGSSLSKYRNKDVQRIEDWINNYPRQVLGYRSARSLFDECMLKIA